MSQISKQVCRTCLVESKQHQSLFDIKEFGEQKITISSMINLCTDVLIKEEDALPKTICNICLNDIDRAFEFRLKCIQSDEQLRKVVSIKEESFLEDNLGPLICEVTISKSDYEDEDILEERDRLELELCDEKATQTRRTRSMMKNEKNFGSDITKSVKQRRRYNINSNNSKTLKASIKLLKTQNSSSIENLQIFEIQSEPPVDESECNQKYEDSCSYTLLTYSNDDRESGIKPTEADDIKNVEKITLPNDSVPTLETKDLNSDFVNNTNDLKTNDSHDSDTQPNEDNDTEDYSTSEEEESEDNHKSKIPSQMHNTRGFPKGKFKCTLCPKTFREERRLTRHLEIHARPKYKCEICDKELLTAGSLTFHMAKHTDTKPYKCEVCEKEILGKYHFDIHKRTHYATNKFKCTQCTQVMTTPETYEAHMKIHNGENPYKCDICNTEYTARSSYTKHMKHSHPEDEEVYENCPECGKSIRKVTFLKHLKIHYGEKKFVCEICGKAFIFSNHLKKHITTHSGEKNFQCQFCALRFSSNQYLQRHISQIHEKNSHMKCETCDYSTYSKHAMSIHLRIHTGEKPFRCEICLREFARKTALRLHYNIHTDEEKARLMALKAMDTATHPDAKGCSVYDAIAPHYVLCDICGKSLNKKAILKHKQTHSEMRPFSCEQCDKSFRNKSNLQVHQQKHSRNTLYQCDICDKKFHWKESYEKHTKTHSGERPHKCHLCGHAFAWKQVLKKHLEAHARGRVFKSKLVDGVSAPARSYSYDDSESSEHDDDDDDDNSSENEVPQETIREDM